MWATIKKNEVYIKCMLKLHLNGDLRDEVYMQPPPSLTHPSCVVYKLKRALYGLNVVSKPLPNVTRDTVPEHPRSTYNAIPIFKTQHYIKVYISSHLISFHIEFITYPIYIII